MLPYTSDTSKRVVDVAIPIGLVKFNYNFYNCRNPIEVYHINGGHVYLVYDEQGALLLITKLIFLHFRESQI